MADAPKTTRASVLDGLRSTDAHGTVLWCPDCLRTIAIRGKLSRVICAGAEECRGALRHEPLGAALREIAHGR